MKHRGLGFVFQPQYRDKHTGELKKTATWWISYSAHGKRVRESAETTSEAAAVRFLKRRIGEVQAGKAVGAQVDRTTLDDMLAMLEADYRANGRRSLERARFAFPHLREGFGTGNCRARDITVDRVTSYKAARLEAGAAAATINCELAILRRAFHLAAKAGKVGSRPEIEALRLDNARKGFFEPEQYRAVLRHLPEYLRPIATAAQITGWRTRSELATRQWRHVDLDAGWIRLEPGESKNREGRMFPLTPELRDVLKSQRDHVSEIERTTGRIVPWVFCRPDGSPLGNFRKAWTTACSAAGVPGRLMHDFRRTAVRNLERAGVPRSAAMKLTGHLTESVYRRYAIVDESMLTDAVSKLAALHAAEQDCQSSVKVTALPIKKAQ